MNSIAIGWKKQEPEVVHYTNRKIHGPKKSSRKTEPPKQQQTTKNTERHAPKGARQIKFLGDEQPYAPLEASIFSAIPAKPPRRSMGVIPINWNTQLCTTRGAAVTFIIIFILIVAAGASVGIVFAAINSKNSSGSGNNNSNQNLFATVSSGTLTSTVSIGSQTGLPCSAYTTINDPTRNSNLTGSTSYCDNGPIFNTSRGGAWIRFVGAGGTTIPTAPPGVQHCGTFLPGWYNGTLPTVLDTITNSTICFQTYADDCGLSTDILTVHCTGNFYIYFLPPTLVCTARYCTA